jgi:outer membrane protein
MKLNKTLALLAVALGFGAFSSSAQAQLKVGTIDMKSIFDNYGKTKEAEAKINEARGQAKKELDDRLAEFNKVQEAARKLNDDANKPELSKDKKESMVKELNAKIQELGNLQREIQSFQQTREQQLAEQSVRSRNAIVEEINKVIDAKVKSGGYDMVFDKSGQSLNAVNVILHSKDSFDITKEIADELGKAKAAAPAAPAAPAADKKK